MDSPPNPAPGGFAQLPAGLLRIWPYLPEHHMRLLPMILSFMPKSFPKQRTLAALIGVSRRQTVNETVQQIEESGLLVVEHRQREHDKRNDSCLYALANVDDVAVADSIIAWYRERFTDTPMSKCFRNLAEGTSDCFRKVAEALSGPTPDTPCPVQDRTPSVRSKTGQPLCGLGPDSIKRQWNTQQNTQGEEYLEAAPRKGPSGPDPMPVSVITEAKLGKDTSGLTDQSAAPAGPASPARQKSRSLQDDLTEDERRRVCSSLDSMTTGLLFGIDAVGARDVTGFAPISLNWRQFAGIDSTTGKPSNVNIDRWGHNAFMGHYWFRVCRHRAQRDQPLALPKWPRLSGEIKNLLATMAKAQAYDFIVKLTTHFDVIRWMNPGIGQTLILDETSLSNSRVRQTVLNLQQMSKHQIAEAYEAIQAGQKFFDYLKPSRAG